MLRRTIYKPDHRANTYESGDLTRGRGMTETQRTIWLLSMPAGAGISQARE